MQSYTIYGGVQQLFCASVKVFPRYLSFRDPVGSFNLFWNSIPKDIRELQNYDAFQLRLREHLWMWEFSEFNSEINTSYSSTFLDLFQLNDCMNIE